MSAPFEMRNDTVIDTFIKVDRETGHVRSRYSVSLSASASYWTQRAISSGCCRS
jgi:hypothetical protein